MQRKKGLRGKGVMTDRTEIGEGKSGQGGDVIFLMSMLTRGGIDWGVEVISSIIKEEKEKGNGHQAKGLVIIDRGVGDYLREIQEGIYVCLFGAF